MYFSAATRGFYDTVIHGDNIPVDSVEITADHHAELLAAQSQGANIQPDGNGYPEAVFPPPTREQIEAAIIADLSGCVQRHLDDTAKQRNYDGILSLCTYATSTNAQFAAEGQTGVTWRDAVWAKCYQVLADCLAGTRNTPTEAELIAELPVMVWP